MADTLVNNNGVVSLLAGIGAGAVVYLVTSAAGITPIYELVATGITIGAVTIQLLKN